ncbi:transcriptional regulator [Thioalkalicoccus limnaeus]|uniref:Transcriptional regulator n=1 Tax=Thioalkalicoccus limnaeus TaxID=120681 RepID=A0ABV4BA46_9GAMM
MWTHKRKVLTIITESALERVLLEDIERLGAHGYTVSDVRGKGHRGVRTSAWDTNANIRVEVVCDAETAAAIASRLKDQYYENYAIIQYIADVEVLRPERF